MALRVVAAVSFLMFGLVMFFADRPLFQLVDWTNPWPVSALRTIVILAQVCTLLYLSYANFRSASAPPGKLEWLFVGVLILLGIVFSILGWIKIDTLLKDLAVHL